MIDFGLMWDLFIVLKTKSSKTKIHKEVLKGYIVFFTVNTYVSLQVGVASLKIKIYKIQTIRQARAKS